MKKKNPTGLKIAEGTQQPLTITLKRRFSIKLVVDGSPYSKAGLENIIRNTVDKVLNMQPPEARYAKGVDIVHLEIEELPCPTT